MSYTSLGVSLPDLTISAAAAPAASWDGPIAVSVNVRNIGASTFDEPLALAPGSISSADAPPSTVTVYAARNPHKLKNSVKIGTFTVPLVPQNSSVQLNETLTLANRPKGFPGDGGKIYVYAVANSTNTVVESDYANNASVPTPVFIEAPLPDLVAVALDMPPKISPGDTIQPNIEIANLGTADTDVQGPVTVALIASVTPDFGPGSSVVGVYKVANIPGISTITTQSPTVPQVFGTATLTPQNNVVTIVSAPVTVPASPRTYYLGVVIDPNNLIHQIHGVANASADKHGGFSLPTPVGPPLGYLPPAGVVTAGGAALVPTFPEPLSSTTGGSGIVGVGGSTPVGPQIAGATTPQTLAFSGVLPDPISIASTVNLTNFHISAAKLKKK